MTKRPDPFSDLPAETAARVLRDLQQLPAATGYLIALSGGLDSMVLLEALSRYRQIRPGLRLRALHIHHGLSPNADSWAEHCLQACQQRQIPCQVRQVQVARDSGEGLEAAARIARYQTFEAELAAGEVLVQAHHQDDQAETLMLNLVRGSGVRGLAAMPQSRPVGRGTLYRPLLDWSRNELESLAQSWRLTWVEDESNQEQVYDRNFLRLEILPRLKTRWPALTRRLAQTSTWCREADLLLGELAQLDAQAAITPAGELEIPALLELSPPRQRNLVRFWIEGQGAVAPSERVFERIFSEVMAARVDACPELSWSGVCLRRYRNCLVLTKAEPAVDLQQVLDWNLRDPLGLSWGELRAVLHESSVAGSSLLRLPGLGERVTVRFRQGGESCRMPHSGLRRPLKKLLQEWGVPTWLRSQLPLIYFNDELAAVPGYLVAQGFVAEPGAVGVELAWMPN